MSEHRHIDATTTRCTDCGTYCTVDRPCYCCLAAEVDDLKARLISALAPAEPSYEELQAQVQRVREVCVSWQGYDVIDRAMSPHLLMISKDEAAEAIFAALDGDSDE